MEELAETGVEARARVPTRADAALVAARYRLRLVAARRCARTPARRCGSCSSRPSPTPTSTRSPAPTSATRPGAASSAGTPSCSPACASRASTTCSRPRDLGRGVVLNFVHHGYYDGAFPSIARLGRPARTWWSTPTCSSDGRPALAAAARQGRLAERRHRGQRRHRHRRACSTCCGAGEVVAIASDVPGRTPLRFVGRDVLGSFGAARLATDADAPVVVMTSEEDADGPVHPAARAARPRRLRRPARRCSSGCSRIHESVHRSAGPRRPTCRCPAGARRSRHAIARGRP